MSFQAFIWDEGKLRRAGIQPNINSLLMICGTVFDLASISPAYRANIALSSAKDFASISPRDSLLSSGHPLTRIYSILFKFFSRTRGGAREIS